MNLIPNEPFFDLSVFKRMKLKFVLIILPKVKCIVSEKCLVRISHISACKVGQDNGSYMLLEPVEDHPYTVPTNSFRI